MCLVQRPNSSLTPAPKQAPLGTNSNHEGFFFLRGNILCLL